MSKLNALVLHPRDWAVAKYSENAKLKYHHLYIGHPVPRKRNGDVTYDGYADCVTHEGQALFRDAIKRLQPRVVLIWMHAGFPNALFEYARNTCKHAVICHWYGNHRYELPKGVDRVKDFVDVLLINSKEPQQYEMYRKSTDIKHIETLYDGFAPNEAVFRPTREEYDCFFGGNTYLRKSVTDDRFRFPGSELRYDFIYRVAQRFNLALCSDQAHGWKKTITPLAPVYHPEYTHAMRRAKVTLNVNHFPFYKAYTRRTIRSIFAGRPHVTNYIPGMEDDFEYGKHMYWFKTIEEGIEQIDRLLKDEQLRNKMAHDCLELAKERHTFEVRLFEFERMLMNIGII